MWTDEIIKQIDEWLTNDKFVCAVSMDIIDLLLNVKKQIEKEKIVKKQFDCLMME